MFRIKRTISYYCIMKYERVPQNGLVVITFNGEDVETVRTAFRYKNDLLRAVGNDSSISTHQKLIEEWKGDEEAYRGPNHVPVIEALMDYYEATDHVVDEILDTPESPTRALDAEERYKLGQNAVLLASMIEVSADLETAWRDADPKEAH